MGRRLLRTEGGGGCVVARPGAPRRVEECSRSKLAPQITPFPSSPPPRMRSWRAGMRRVTLTAQECRQHRQRRTHHGQARDNHPEAHRRSRTPHRTRRNAPRSDIGSRPVHAPRLDPPPQPGKGLPEGHAVEADHLRSPARWLRNVPSADTPLWPALGPQAFRGPSRGAWPSHDATSPAVGAQ